MKNKPKIGKVRAAIINWLGGGSITVNGDMQIGASSISGVPVTENRALQLSAVWACARLISETIGTLPLSIYERTSTGRRVAREHPLHFIVHDQANQNATASVYWEAVVAGMLLRGEAISEKIMLGNRLVGLRFLHPSKIQWRGNDGKDLWYRDSEGAYRHIPKTNLWVIPGWSLDGVTGVSVIRYGANVFGAAISNDDTSATLSRRGLIPQLWIKYPRLMTEAQRDGVKGYIDRRATEIEERVKPVVLEADMDIGVLNINPKDAQLLETRAFSTEEICRWFRVPPWMIGHTEKSTSWGTGIEQQMIAFLTFTLSPWLKRIEQSIAKDLLSPADRIKYYSKFSVEGLLRADSAGRANFYSTMVNNGLYTRDEVRAKEDLEPMGGNADVLTVQLAMTKLDDIGIEEG